MKLNYLKLISLVLIFSVLINSCKDDNDITDAYTETEPNGTFATASELTKSFTYDAKINPSQDQDYFFINATSDIKITIDGDSNLELFMKVYDENQIQIFADGTGARGATLTHTIVASEYDGKLYIYIESAYPDDIGDYTILLN